MWALTDANFKVWLSQSEAKAGLSIYKNAMQKGVRESEVLLLLMTDGIFHHNRYWVTNTEVSYGVKKCDKPLICLCPQAGQGGFDFKDKCEGLLQNGGGVHPKGCCRGVHASFQPFARAIPVALDVVDWDASEGDSENQDKIMQTVVCEIVKRFLLRDSAREMLKRELALQTEAGVCTFDESHSSTAASTKILQADDYESTSCGAASFNSFELEDPDVGEVVV